MGKVDHEQKENESDSELILLGSFFVLFLLFAVIINVKSSILSIFLFVLIVEI
jgi:hypothetical protein